MIKIVLILIILTLIAVSFFIFSQPDKDDTSTPEGPIVLFGDSLVAGVGASPGGDIASVLSKRLSMPVLNKGISGNTTGDALARVDTDVVLERPSIVVVIIGGNDFLRRVPKTTTLSNLQTIIEKIQATGAVVVLAGIEPLVYNGDYRKISKDYNTRFIPNILSLTRGKDNLMSDTIHPNDAGYILFADAIEKEIRFIKE